MKKFNKNMILFVFAALFIALGFCISMIKGLGRSALDSLSALKRGNIDQALAFNTNVDDTTQKRLRYHNLLMDINSIKDNLLGTRVVLKDDDNIIKSDSGSLVVAQERIDSDVMADTVNKIDRLRDVAENNGAQFLFCFVPTKAMFEKLPENVSDHSAENYEHFISEMNNSGIPLLDFNKMLTRDGFAADNYYFTDHHWTARAGFKAAAEICRELNSRYGFEYDPEYADINNYTVKSYSDWFLGSYGKKVGTHFTPRGADDFELITPNFDTEMTEAQPIKNHIRKGSFDETVLYLSNVKKDYYKKNAYATYSGGDFRLQIMKNELNPNGKKILLIRDSIACVVSPFLALQTSELHICDVRDYEYLVGDKLNMEEYIREISPDYVLVLYLSNGFDGSRYDFF